MGKKLTQSERCEILSALACGARATDLAQKYNCNIKTILRIKNSEAGRDVFDQIDKDDIIQIEDIKHKIEESYSLAAEIAWKALTRINQLIGKADIKAAAEAAKIAMEILLKLKPEGSEKENAIEIVVTDEDASIDLTQTQADEITPLTDSETENSNES